MITPGNCSRRRLCLCCQRDNAIMGKSRVPDGLPSGVRVCGICSRHQSNDPKSWARRDQDHRDLWAEDARELAEQNANKLAAEQASTETLRTQLAEEIAKRPPHVVHRNLDQEIVHEAEAERDSAYRSRDQAFQALSEVWLLHRDAGSDRCRCGRKFSQCDTAAIVNRYRALEQWERRQWERRRQRRDHMLPRNHPAVTDPRWTPATQPEAQHHAS